MSNYMYERLTAQDNSFLVAEGPNAPIHIAAVGIYEAEKLTTAEGGIDVRRIKQFLASRLHEIPRYRQKLMWVPVENRPVWIDDPYFRLDYHIRHAALPRPGGIEELKKLTARITTRQLDRSRPLWEMWVIEGIEGDRFALVSKIHHCMVDGTAGADLAQILNSPFPSTEVGEPRPYIPRQAPGPVELFSDAAKRTIALPFRMMRALGSLDPTSPELSRELKMRAGAMRDMVESVIRPSSDTPINGPLGPNRRIDWLTLPLDDVKAVRRALDCTVNDVVLASVTGAMRQYLLRRGVNVSKIDFRVSAPVNMRDASNQGSMGNQVSSWVVGLPIDEDDPIAQLEGIRVKTEELKRSKQALGVDMMMKAAEYAPASLLAMGARAASGPINMIVTNVPGPQFPLYVLGARMIEMQPLVPLLDGTGLGIALFSYDGKLHIGLNADYELVPDLENVAVFLAQSFMALADACGVGVPTQDSAPEEEPVAEEPAALDVAEEEEAEDEVQASEDTEQLAPEYETPPLEIAVQ